MSSLYSRFDLEDLKNKTNIFLILIIIIIIIIIIFIIINNNNNNDNKKNPFKNTDAYTAEID